jgi:poly(3-hydroxybutyrate) depolymerase
MRALLLAAVGFAMFAAFPAPAEASVRVSTYSVPVTTPDSTGASVTLDTDVYVPDRKPPSGGFPLLEFFHGGGSTKDNGYDAGHARSFAEHGYVTLLYSARGHGNSTGQVTVAGPAEMRDLFDVTAWALRIGGRTLPRHLDFHIDRARIALSGYSQGGLHTNLGQVWSKDPSIDPYGISFRALEPGNTPDVTFNALVPNQVVKLSYGVGLIETYLVGSSARIAP